MKVLVVGSTGLLGQAVLAEVLSRGWSPVTAARSGADLKLDIGDIGALEACLRETHPDVLFNCAALTDLGQCERDPGLAYRMNARPVSAMADWSRRTDRRLVHVSTDHFFVGGGDTPHREHDPVHLVNEYARTKFAAEAFALTAFNALVFRTSIVGMRGWTRESLAEWAIRAVLENAPMQLFTDAFTSSIDVGCFARAAFDVALQPDARGLFNLAAREVYSKARFVQELAAQMGRSLDNATLAPLTSSDPPRAGCLGLDVTRVQKLLRFQLPGLSAVVEAVLAEHARRNGR